jgi:hypothetical protein
VRQAFSILGGCAEKRFGWLFAGGGSARLRRKHSVCGRIGGARGKISSDLCGHGEEGGISGNGVWLIDGCRADAFFGVGRGDSPPSIFCGASVFFCGQSLLEMTDQLVRVVSVGDDFRVGMRRRGNFYCAHVAMVCRCGGGRRLSDGTRGRFSGPLWRPLPLERLLRGGRKE